jgi:hypothetical protein
MKARRVKKLDPVEPLAGNAARIIRVRLDELRSFAPAALQPENAKAQHNMRIAAKRLRYVLELTEFCFGKSAATARHQARDLQDLLGELHDCDVMLPKVEEHLAELREADAAVVRERAGEATDLDPRLAARAPHRTAYRGLEILVVHLQARRQLLFERFREAWARQERSGTWAKLDRTVDRRLGCGHENRRAAKRATQASRELQGAERQQREAPPPAADPGAPLRLVPHPAQEPSARPGT